VQGLPLLRPGTVAGIPRTAAIAVAVGGLLLAATTLAQGIGDLGFTTRVSDRLVEQFVQRFREPARARIDAWKRFARDQKPASPRELEQLGVVNRFLNRVPFVEDEVHWRMADYWATPGESVASNGADCEDFSIAKYFLLKELGVPVTRLRMVYVKSLRLNQAHMVLAYYATPGADPLVLDNLEDTVRPASQRTDLVPVYSFNDEDVWVEARGRIGSPRQIRNWAALLARLDAEART
jgi:predicted transglutaminase-like cysteine proteinase